MDPSLLREREAFKRKALSQPSVEKRKEPAISASSSRSNQNYSQSSSFSNNKQPPNNLQSKSSGIGGNGGSTGSTGSATAGPTTSNNFHYKNAPASSSVRFAVLGKIIKHMRTRHLQGEDYGLTVDEVLNETKQYDVSAKIRAWLTSEALPNNAKMKLQDGKYIYKPSFDIKEKKGFLRLLEEQHIKGAGGILMDDIEESLPDAQKIIQEVESNIVMIKRPNDKRQVLFYKDPSVVVSMPEDIVKLWRSATVDGMDAKKIADYLDKHGFSFIKSDQKLPLGMGKKRGRKGLKGGKFIPKHNEHMADILQDYSAKLAK